MLQSPIDGSQLSLHRCQWAYQLAVPKSSTTYWFNSIQALGQLPQIPLSESLKQGDYSIILFQYSLWGQKGASLCLSENLHIAMTTCNGRLLFTAMAVSHVCTCNNHWKKEG